MKNQSVSICTGGGGAALSARLGIEDTLASSRGANERERRGGPVKNVAFSSG